MERHYNANFTYTGAATSGGDTGQPAAFAAHSPASEPFADRRYDLTIENSTNSNFILRATPVAGTSQAGDGFLSYWGDGRKGWDQNNNGSITTGEFCWSC